MGLAAGDFILFSGGEKFEIASSMPGSERGSGEVRLEWDDMGQKKVTLAWGTEWRGRLWVACGWGSVVVCGGHGHVSPACACFQLPVLSAS